jgi:hypothetical protein
MSTRISAIGGALLFVCLAAPFFVSRVHAQSGVFGGTIGLDPSFCKTHNIRQTVVYIDDSILVTGHTEWALTIYNKLKATLVPGEKVSVVELSPLNGQSNEVWSGCWPAYSAEEKANLNSQTWLLKQNPVNALPDQQTYFANGFGVAAEKIEQKGARPASAVTIDPNNPPQKSILRALASDGTRYSHADSTVRAILYSDLAENSYLGSVFKPLPPDDPTYGATLGTYLRRSVFYAFGVGNDMQGGGGKILDDTRHFWQAALRSMAANLNGFGSDLSVPNTMPVAAQNFNLTLKENGTDLDGRMYLLIDSDGILVDSWIGIDRLRNAAINGSYRCTGPTDTSACSLRAKTEGGVVTANPVETIGLTSRGSRNMTGKLGVQGTSALFSLVATPDND